MQLQEAYSLSIFLQPKINFKIYQYSEVFILNSYIIFYCNTRIIFSFNLFLHSIVYSIFYDLYLIEFNKPSTLHIFNKK